MYMDIDIVPCDYSGMCPYVDDGHSCEDRCGGTKQKGEKMEKFYIVETMNELTITREHHHTEASTAQEAVDDVKDKIGDMRNYSILNVFVETEEEWQ